MKIFVNSNEYIAACIFIFVSGTIMRHKEN